ncbi:unnamed protein product [Vitrella brassicaformis CCMP3155]|uniref:Peptidase C14 caspase domain-containing protein n=3 Tax=Vitrella brassicaformis TaxID=1169539 RepID=A0A0G4EFK1_VITBC|nr:unnamed protein product [Vitrella brassicaformis CCMP3155]|eukprot:CEL94507.1 unnamed protein product [Vitrella brassicaformis CCMP3155]
MDFSRQEGHRGDLQHIRNLQGMIRDKERVVDGLQVEIQHLEEAAGQSKDDTWRLDTLLTNMFTGKHSPFAPAQALQQQQPRQRGGPQQGSWLTSLWESLFRDTTPGNDAQGMSYRGRAYPQPAVSGNFSPYGERCDLGGVPGPWMEPMWHRRRALCVGVNYAGSTFQLGGAVSDCMRWSRVLRITYDFDVRVLADESDDGFVVRAGRRPTKANILEGIRWLLHGCLHGDLLVLFFAGCSTQVPDAKRPEQGESALLPCDYCERDIHGYPQLIYTHEIRKLISYKSIPPGAQLLAVLDCGCTATFSSAEVTISTQGSDERHAKMQRRFGKPPCVPLSWDFRMRKGSNRATKLIVSTSLRPRQVAFQSVFGRTKTPYNSWGGWGCGGAAEQREEARDRAAGGAIFCVSAVSSGRETPVEAQMDDRQTGFLTCCLMAALAHTTQPLPSLWEVFAKAGQISQILRRDASPSVKSLVDQHFALSFDDASPPQCFIFPDPHNGGSPFTPQPHHWPGALLPDALSSFSPLPATAAGPTADRFVDVYVESVRDVMSPLGRSAVYQVTLELLCALAKAKGCGDTNAVFRWSSSREVAQPGGYQGLGMVHEAFFRANVRAPLPGVPSQLVCCLWAVSDALHEGEQCIGCVTIDISDVRLRRVSSWPLRRGDYRGPAVGRVVLEANPLIQVDLETHPAVGQQEKETTGDTRQHLPTPTPTTPTLPALAAVPSVVRPVQVLSRPFPAPQPTAYVSPVPLFHPTPYVAPPTRYYYRVSSAMPTTTVVKPPQQRPTVAKDRQLKTDPPQFGATATDKALKVPCSCDCVGCL